MTNGELIRRATDLAGEFRASDTCTAGSVAAALVTRAGNVYTGICVDTTCSLGFCAEHAAVAEMLKGREREIDRIVAVRADGSVLLPCGRCRELLWQVTSQPMNIAIVVGADSQISLSELLPRRASRP
ncbi:MAG: cytidine deaminase [Thermoanaerobaculia bacterium]|nr:cytidine deaminase [Thermoanaerobaculia bacterium]